MPVGHEDDRIAGAASFIPHFQLRAFLDHAEKLMLEEILPKDVFDKVVRLKSGEDLHEKPVDVAGDESIESYNKSLDEDFETMIKSMRKAHSPEQVEAVLGTIEREREEVMDALMRDGGDVDEVIAKVSAKTMETKRKIIEDLNKEVTEAEILDDKSSSVK